MRLRYSLVILALLLATPAAFAANATPPNTASPRLFDQLRTAIRLRDDSIRIQTAYVDWARRYIRFHGLRHPREMGAAEVEAFLSDLEVQRQVSASTQSQARAALLFLYKDLLGHADVKMK